MDRLRIGTYLAPNIVPVYEAVTDEIGRRLGIPAELVVETDYESCKRDENDVCFVCSLPYVMFERQGISPADPVAAFVLQGERYAGAPVCFSDVIVHRESPFRSFDDLRGRSWSYNERLSHSGYGITRYHLLRMGETSGFFCQVVEAGFHEESIRWCRAARSTPRPSIRRCSRSPATTPRCGWTSGHLGARSVDDPTGGGVEAAAEGPPW